MQTSPAKLNRSTIETDLEPFLRSVFEQEIADRSITIIVESAQANAGTSVSVQPSRAECAQITAFCENGGAIIYLTIGANTLLEVPVEDEDSEKIITLVRAVAAGRFEETLWIRDSEIVKSVGKLFVDEGTPIKIRNWDLTKALSFLLSEKRVKKYLPYNQ